MPEFDCGTSVYGNIEEEVPNDCQSHGEGSYPHNFCRCNPF